MGFQFFNFSFKYLKRLQSSEPLHKNASNHPLCWDHRLYGHKLRSFSPNCAPNMWESQQFFFGLRLASRIFEENQQSAIQTKMEQHFSGFFQQMKVQQLIGRKDS
jgi:hypothetical protein